MKEINESLQMKIFDLLEGNLSEKEKAEVLNLIAASPELQKEYDLMAKTYLQQDESIVFAEKHKLYRRPGMAVVWKPLMRYAAAAALLAVCGVAGWYFSREGNTANTLATETKTRQAMPDASGESHTTPEKAAEQHLTTAPLFRKQATPLKTSKHDTPAFIVPAIEEHQDFDVLPEQQMVIADNPVDVSEMEPEVMDSTENATAQQVPVNTAKKRSLSYKLLHNSRQMMANLQLPQVKFRAERNANKTMPTIKMEIRTLKTDVIATLID